MEKNLRQISKEKEREVSNPAWTPDGQYLVTRKHFRNTRSLGAGEMWLYHLYGGSGLKLTDRRNWEQNATEPIVSHVGCGAGHSAIALAKYCTQVYACDRSHSMLARAVRDHGVTYFGAAAERLPIEKNSVDIVTLAGSLFYLDHDATCEEIRTVCRRNAEVIVYDFELQLDEILERYGIHAQALVSEYNHQVNFSGAPGFTEVLAMNERVRVEMSASELTHVLLSDSNRLDQSVRNYGTADPFDLIERDLRASSNRLVVGADSYCSMYRV